MAEKSRRLKNLQPYKMLNFYNSTKEAIPLWANPKLLKYSKYAGFLGTVGDIINSLGILYNVYQWHGIGKGEGWTASNIADGVFGAIGFWAGYGDAIAGFYMLTRMQMDLANENPERFIRSSEIQMMIY